MEAVTLKGFRALPVKLAPPGTCIHLAPGTQKDGVASEPHHFFFFKEHSVRKPSKELPKGRTLFLLNLPLGGQAVLEEFMAAYGKVESVTVKDMSIGSSSKGTLQHFPAAYVVFASPKTLQAVLKLEYNPATVLPAPKISGSQRFLAAFDALYVERGRLKAQVDAAVAEFDDKQAQAKARALAAAVPDQEGWTLVTAKTLEPSGTDATGEQGEAPADAADPKAKKKKRAELANFYKFQRLEAHKQQLAVLRKRFDEDRKRMEVLREARRFRPY